MKFQPADCCCRSDLQREIRNLKEDFPLLLILPGRLLVLLYKEMQDVSSNCISNSSEWYEPPSFFIISLDCCWIIWPPFATIAPATPNFISTVKSFGFRKVFFKWHLPPPCFKNPFAALTMTSTCSSVMSFFFIENVWFVGNLTCLLMLGSCGLKTLALKVQ